MLTVTNNEDCAFFSSLQTRANEFTLLIQSTIRGRVLFSNPT